MNTIYKIFHRQYGQIPYYPESQQDALEMLELMQLLDYTDRQQYYIREVHAKCRPSNASQYHSQLEI